MYKLHIEWVTTKDGLIQASPPEMGKNSMNYLAQKACKNNEQFENISQNCDLLNQ